MKLGFLTRRRQARRLNAIVDRADEARDAGRFAEAAAAYGSALAFDPGRVELRVQRANMLKDQGELALAEQEYLTALAAAAGQADTHLQLGHLRSLLGRRAEAMSAYRRALELDPGLEDARRAMISAGDVSVQASHVEALRRAQGLSALATLSFRMQAMAEELASMRERLPDVATLSAFPVDAYADYRAIFDLPAPLESEVRAETITIAVILQADGESLEDLHRLIAALHNQSHRAWRLQAIGRDQHRRDIVDRAAAGDDRFAWRPAAENSDPCLTEIQVAAAVETELVLFLAQGAIPHRHALTWIAAAQAHTDCAAMVFDEETGERGAVGGALQPLFRQAVDRDTLLAANVYGETIAVVASALRAVPGPPAHESRAFSRSLLLLELSARGPIAHVPLPLFRTPCSGPSISAEGVAAHRRAVARSSGNPENPVEASAWSPLVSVSRETIAGPGARISVIIPTKDNQGDLWPLLEGLVAKATRPAALEILVLNNGAPGSIQAAPKLLRSGVAFRVIDVPEPFNWSRFNNLAAEAALAPYLVFANDDMRMLSDAWDDVVRRSLERVEVGALGAKLVYPDETIQHAGVLFGWRGSTIHDGLHRSSDDPGPALRWIVPRAVGAVTGAFLATRRVNFMEVGGFDAAHLAIAHSDVDYAMKLRSRGLKILWTPAITLHHFESKSRGLDHMDAARRARDTAEREVMRRRWGTALDEDPSLNPHWRDIALPLQFIAAPTRQSIWASLVRSASSDLWRVAGAGLSEPPAPRDDNQA